MRRSQAALLFGAAIASVAPAEAAVTYRVDINTAPEAGREAYFDLQFVRGDLDNDGNRDTAPALSAVLTNFVTDGVLIGGPQLDGSASGNFATGLSLMNDGDFNALLQRLTLGNSISFNLTLDGDGLSSTASGRTIFGFSFYDAAQFDAFIFAPILTTDPSGSAGELAVQNAMITTDTPAGTVGGPPTATFAAAVPEAATWMMMIGGFGLIGGVTRRRRMPIAA